MTELELVREVVSALGQGAITLIPLVLWLHAKFEKMRASWIADLTAALRVEIDETKAGIRSTRDELDSIKIKLDLHSTEHIKTKLELARLRESRASG
jgi:hypothetical protein